MKMIVKVQLPLAETGHPLALVYNQTRDVERLLIISTDLMRAMEGRNKAFFFASLAAGGRLKIGKPAPWQEW